MPTRLEKAALRAFEEDRRRHRDRIADNWRFTPEQRAEFQQVMGEIDALYDRLHGTGDRGQGD